MDVEAEGRQDWALWMADQIRQADHILVIASAAYRARAQGQSGPTVGRGVQWEARLIRDLAYQDPNGLDRFVPVVLPGGTVDGIPDFLAPATTTVYQVRDFTVAGAESLLRFLTRQPANVPPQLGVPPVLPPISTYDSADQQPTVPTVPHRHIGWRWWVGIGVAVVAVVAYFIATAQSGLTLHSATPPPAHPTTTVRAAPAATDQAPPTSQPPVTSAAPSTFTGRGDDVVAIHRPAGLKIIRFDCPHCDGNTEVQTNGEDGLLVNTVGPYSGQQWADTVSASNTTSITITADSAWTLVVGGIGMARAVNGSVSGTGDDVFMLDTRTNQATIINNGKGNFIVQDMSLGGGYSNLAVNFVGPYQGTVPLYGPALVEITSDGLWSLNATN